MTKIVAYASGSLGLGKLSARREGAEQVLWRTHEIANNHLTRGVVKPHCADMGRRPSPSGGRAVSLPGGVAMATVTEFIRQAAAIPIRDNQVCLITSSNGKRWIIPKGLIDPGHTAGESALQEAWEEAGLVGILSPHPVGSYVYEKWGCTCHVTAFRM